MQRPVIMIFFAALTLTSLSCEGPAGPPGPPGDPYTSMSDPAVMPKVIYTYPVANAVGPFEDLWECDSYYCGFVSQFQIRFNKFMDVTSVRRAVRFSSPYGDIVADTNSITSISGDIYLVRARNPRGSSFWPRVGASYTIAVEGTARDVNGNPLIPSYSGSTVIEPYFRALASSPSEGDTAVPVSGNHRIRFNSKVDQSILEYATISPSVAGAWVNNYFDSASIIFYPTAVLRSGTRYTISVGMGAGDVDGNRLKAPFEVSFKTIAFKASGTYPSDGTVEAPLYLSPTILFSVPLDTSTIRTALQFTPTTVGTIQDLYEGTRYVTFSPTRGLLGNQRYTMRIDTTLRSASGEVLESPVELTFTTAGFRVTSVSPPDSASGVGPYTSIYIYTNALLDNSTVGSSVSISPPIALSVSTCMDCSSASLYPSGGFAPNTWYTVTIGPGLQTKRGEGLAAPTVFSFRTGPN